MHAIPGPPHPYAALRGSSAAVGWEVVDVGMSGARVYRSADGTVHAKSVGSADKDVLRLEREKIGWLALGSIPAPRVIDWEEDDNGAVLVMTTVAGIPACDIHPGLVDRAVASMGDLLAALHALPVDGCPFVRRLDRTVAEAADAVRRGVVDVTDFDDSRRDRTAADLLEELVALRPRAAGDEPADLVVCHGDPCLPNLVVEPDTGNCLGMVDLGRLGVADRYLDLALTVRSMSAPDMNLQYGPRHATSFLARYGIPDPDLWRLDFYCLLDEFS